MSSVSYGRIGVVGSTIGLGQKKAGVDFASVCLRSRHMIKRFSRHCEHVVDFDEVVGADAKVVYGELSKKCERSAQLCDFTAIVGGDHSHSIGTVHGIKRAIPKLKVLWIDAHGDINTPETSPTGNLHGMPLAALLGLFDLNKKLAAPWFHPVLRPNDIALVGVRDLDEGEKRIIKDNGIHCVSSEELDHIGVSEGIRRAIRHIDPVGENPLHLSVDVDCLGAEYISATGLPVENGLSPAQLSEIVSTTALTGRLKSMEVVEFNPLLARSLTDLQVTVEMILGLYDLAFRTKNISPPEMSRSIYSELTL